MILNDLSLGVCTEHEPLLTSFSCSHKFLVVYVASFLLVTHSFLHFCCLFCSSTEKFHTLLLPLFQTAQLRSLIFSFVEGAEQSASYHWLGITGGFNVFLLSSLLSRCIPLDYHDFDYFSLGSQCSL